MPLFNNENAVGTLVRFKGMIQDMLNPEYYSKNGPLFNSENSATVDQVRIIVFKKFCILKM